MLRLSLPSEIGEMVQTFMSKIEWFAALKYRTRGLPLFLTERMCLAYLPDIRRTISRCNFCNIYYKKCSKWCWRTCKGRQKCCLLTFYVHYLFTPTSHLFILRLRLVYWSTLKIVNDLPNFASNMHLLLFLSPERLSVTWLSLLNINSFVLFIWFLFLSDEGPMFETLDYTIRIGSTPTFLYLDIYHETIITWPLSHA